MADEISISLNFAYSKNGLSISQNVATFKPDVTGNHVASGTQAIGTSAENIEKGDITTCGWVLVKNLDGTNFVEIGYDATGFKPTVKILAGEWALFKSAQATLQAKADTAECNIAYWIIEA